MQLAWGARVSSTFRGLVIGMCRRLIIPDPSCMMSCMALENGGTFSPSIRNSAGSGAVGLIQFMPATAAALGTTIEQLAAMTAESQLTFVEQYFTSWTGKLHSLGDVYGAILWPGMIGKPDSAVVFDQADLFHPKRYLQNRGLDLNRDGRITKGEIVARVQAEMDRGMLPGNVFTVPDSATV